MDGYVFCVDCSLRSSSAKSFTRRNRNRNIYLVAQIHALDLCVFPSFRVYSAYRMRMEYVRATGMPDEASDVIMRWKDSESQSSEYR